MHSVREIQPSRDDPFRPSAFAPHMTSCGAANRQSDIRQSNIRRTCKKHRIWCQAESSRGVNKALLSHPWHGLDRETDRLALVLRCFHPSFPSMRRWLSDVRVALMMFSQDQDQQHRLWQWLNCGRCCLIYCFLAQTSDPSLRR